MSVHSRMSTVMNAARRLPLAITTITGISGSLSLSLGPLSLSLRSLQLQQPQRPALQLSAKAHSGRALHTHVASLADTQSTLAPAAATAEAAEPTKKKKKKGIPQSAELVDGELAEPERDHPRIAALKAYVFARSTDQSNWDVASKEWTLVLVHYKKSGMCVCGQDPIFKHCVIRHDTSGEQITVGNECVRHFKGEIGVQSDSMHNSLHYIAKDETGLARANAQLIDMCEKRGIITKKDATVYRLNIRVKKLTAEEQDTISRVNKTIVASLIDKTEPEKPAAAATNNRRRSR